MQGHDELNESYVIKQNTPLPIGSMYGIYANIWGILMVNVTIYTIHGSYGLCKWLKDKIRVRKPRVRTAFMKLDRVLQI